MNRTIATLSGTLLALTISLGATSAWADHNRGLVRINIPIHEHGPETLRLKKLIKHQRHLDLDHYRLQAVVVKNGRHSNGYASLRVGDQRTGRFFLPGRENIRIPAPSHADDHWRLRLGPGTQVRMVTAVLEPRVRGRGHRYDYTGPAGSTASWYRDDSRLNLGWLLRDAQHDKRSKKQTRRLRQTRQELTRTRAELERTQNRLDRSRESNKQLKHRKVRQAEELAQRDRGKHRQADAHPDADRKDTRRKASGRKDAHRDTAERRNGRHRDARELSSVYPRLRTHSG